jgi:hypothetical protein
MGDEQGCEYFFKETQGYTLLYAAYLHCIFDIYIYIHTRHNRRNWKHLLVVCTFSGFAESRFARNGKFPLNVASTNLFDL